MSQRWNLTLELINKPQAEWRLVTAEPIFKKVEPISEQSRPEVQELVAAMETLELGNKEVVIEERRCVVH